MITVACVNWGNYLGMGKRYVDTLRSMVSRNLSQPFEFVCIEKHGDLFGWWVKVALFEPGRFKGRVLYLDLDSVVIDSLDELVEHKGIIDMYDWYSSGKPDKHEFNSSVMVWDAGEHAEVFTKFSRHVTAVCKGGDQEWITKLGGWDPLPEHLCKSYRYHCLLLENPGADGIRVLRALDGPPPGCVHVSFHGPPKPHDVVEGWVPRYWK